MLNQAKPNGFTLIELLVAISIGSLVLMASVKILPILNKSAQIFNEQLRLELLLEQILQVIEKDIKRAGFCSGFNCQGEMLQISQATGESPNSCILIRYDLNKNGIWETTGDDSEIFSYRLKQGAIETHRSLDHCDGVGWEKLLDLDEVFITEFSIQQMNSPASNGVYMLKVNGELKNNKKSQQISQSRTKFVIAENAA